MKTYEVVFDKLKNKGVYGISLVGDPAMEGTFIALSKEDNKIKLAEIDKEQRILIGLVLEPNKPIYRNQDGEEFNIIFNEETIKDLSHNFFVSNSQSNSTIEHEDKQQLKGVTFVESWIVEDSKIDKSANFGMSYPKGSWIATMKVDNDDIWNDYVKTGEVKGFSVDAMVNLKEINLKSEVNMSNQLVEALKGLPEKIALALKPKEVEVVEVVEEVVKLGSVMSADGAVTIEYDGEQLQAGVNVFVMDGENKVPLPIGEYELEGGLILVVTEVGMAAEIKEPEVVEEELATPNDDAATLDAIENAIKSIMIKYSADVDLKFEANKKEIADLKSEILELGKQPTTKPVKSAPVQVDLSKMSNFQRLKYNEENGLR